MNYPIKLLGRDNKGKLDVSSKFFFLLFRTLMRKKKQIIAKNVS